MVGHIPRTISSICSIFIRRGGSIVCKVKGSREYSSDLEQGGLQLPCELTFRIADSVEFQKTRQSFKIMSVETLEVDEAMETDEPCVSRKSPQMQTHENVTSSSSFSPQCSHSEEQRNFVDLTLPSSNEEVLVHSPLKKRLKVFDTEGIIMGNELSDDEINFAQQLLKEQFNKLNGLHSTLLQGKRVNLTESETKNKIQIIHCYSHHHWIVASTVGCALDQVKVYDSSFSHCDTETEAIVCNLFQWNKSSKLTITVSRSQRQKGATDCRLFAIANATAIAHGKNPSKLQFKQDSMRAHLIACFDQKHMSLFPSK